MCTFNKIKRIRLYCRILKYNTKYQNICYNFLISNNTDIKLTNSNTILLWSKKNI